MPANLIDSISLKQFISLSDLIYIGLDTNGDIIFANDKTCEILDCKSSDILGKNWYSTFIPQNVRDTILPLYKRLAAGQMDNLEYFENEIITLKDNQKLIAWHNSFIKDNAGNIIGTLSSGRDITDQRSLEKNYLKSEKRFETLFESTYDAVMLLDENGFFDCNPATTALFKVESKDAFLKLHPADLSPEFQPNGQNSIELSNQRIKQALKKGHLIFEWIHKTSCGRLFPAEVLLSSMPYDDRTVLQATVRDLTKQKEHHKKTLESQKMESVGKLAAGISHEINTPAQFIKDNLTFLNNSISSIKKLLDKYEQIEQLPSIKSECKVLFNEIEELKDNEDIHYLLEDIPVALEQSKQGIERIVQIISAMKEFATADAESQLHVDVNESISNTLIISKNRWKNILKVETDFEKDLPLIPCYAAKINNVFLEMILNSCDAVVKRFINDDQKQGHLKIITRLKSDHLEIKFIDNGAGIEKKIADRVYDPFFTTKTVGQGTGQGLTTVYDIVVNKHSGELFFESDTDSGTTFFVRLPVGGKESSHSIINDGIY